MMYRHNKDGEKIQMMHVLIAIYKDGTRKEFVSEKYQREISKQFSSDPNCIHMFSFFTADNKKAPVETLVRSSVNKS